VLAEMFELQDDFAAQKGLPRIERRLVSEMAKAGVLDVSFVRDASGNPMAWRSYYRGSRRMRVLHGGSLFRAQGTSAERQLYGRANRLLSYKDIFRARDLGIQEFDFGGWYIGHEDQEKLSINSFKEEFGGVVIDEFHCFRGGTLKGKLALVVMEQRNRLLARRRGRRGQPGPAAGMRLSGMTVTTKNE
jgi:hypothetical protein